MKSRLGSHSCTAVASLCSQPRGSVLTAHRGPINQHLGSGSFDAVACATNLNSQLRLENRGEVDRTVGAAERSAAVDHVPDIALGSDHTRSTTCWPLPVGTDDKRCNACSLEPALQLAP